MKTFILLLSLIFSSLSQAAYEGDGVIGGGDGILSEAGVQLLDFYEKEAFNPSAMDDYALVRARLTSLDNAFYEFHFENYRYTPSKMYYLPYLLKEAENRLSWYFTDQKLPDVNDEGLCFIDQNLDALGEAKIQLAVQIPHLNMVIIHRPSYKKLDKKSLIGLFLHEITENMVFNEAPDLLQEPGIKGQKCGTAKVRTFVSHIMMPGYQSLSYEKKVAEPFKLGFPVAMDEDTYYESNETIGGIEIKDMFRGMDQSDFARKLGVYPQNLSSEQQRKDMKWAAARAAAMTNADAEIRKFEAKMKEQLKQNEKLFPQLSCNLPQSLDDMYSEFVGYVKKAARKLPSDQADGVLFQTRYIKKRDLCDYHREFLINRVNGQSYSKARQNASVVVMNALVNRVEAQIEDYTLSNYAEAYTSPLDFAYRLMDQSYKGSRFYRARYQDISTAANSGDKSKRNWEK